MANLDFLFIYFSCIFLCTDQKINASKLIHDAMCIYLSSYKYNTCKNFLGDLPQLTNNVLQMTYMGRPVCAYFKNEGTVRKNPFLFYSKHDTKVHLVVCQ